MPGQLLLFCANKLYAFIVVLARCPNAPYRSFDQLILLTKSSDVRRLVALEAITYRIQGLLALVLKYLNLTQAEMLGAVLRNRPGVNKSGDAPLLSQVEHPTAGCLKQLGQVAPRLREIAGGFGARRR